jgi:hypothetical protein
MYYAGYYDQPDSEKRSPRLDISAKLQDEINAKNIDDYLKY